MKIAVTGATGFLGRHVLSELGNHSVEVVAGVRKSSLSNFGACDIRTVPIDMENSPSEVFELLGRPNALIHLAWGGLPHYSSLHHFEEELPIQYRFLSGLVKAGLPGLVVTGTCFEYGMQSGQLSEAVSTHPVNPYGLAKDTLRRQLEYLRQSQPFAFTWARLFYVYGDGQAENSLLPQLQRTVSEGHRAFNMSGGEQLRDYLPVSEIAKTLVSLALRKADVGVLNVCSGKPISIRKLVEAWIEANGWSIKLNLGYYPYSQHEPMAFWGDRKKLDFFVAS